MNTQAVMLWLKMKLSANYLDSFEENNSLLNIVRVYSEYCSLWSRQRDSDMIWLLICLDGFNKSLNVWFMKLQTCVDINTS